MNVELSAPYFFSETFDFQDGFLGECEDCGRIVPEWSLLQCQYGFCGKFCCSKCGYRCRKCGDDEPRSVSLCSSHAIVIYPLCDGCKKQFCDVCTKISVVQVRLFSGIFLKFKVFLCTWHVKDIYIITTCLDTRQPGSAFKKLDTRQSEILTKSSV